MRWDIFDIFQTLWSICVMTKNLFSNIRMYICDIHSHSSIMILLGFLITLTSGNFIHHPHTKKYCLRQATKSCQNGMKYYEEVIPLFNACPTPKWILENRVAWWDGRKLIENRDYLEHETGMGIVTGQTICKNVWKIFHLSSNSFIKNFFITGICKSQDLFLL